MRHRHHILRALSAAGSVALVTGTAATVTLILGGSELRGPAVYGVAALSAACAVLLAVGAAAFALRKSERGLLGSLQRLLSDGFAVAVAKTMAEASDVATDGLAVNDVLNNAALASFHTTYGVAFALGSCVSLFVLVKRCFEIRRKFDDPTLKQMHQQHTSQQSEAPPRLQH